VSDTTQLELSTRLAKCEATIEAGLMTFLDVGNAIREIRDDRLYRESYSTFEEYCRERWDWSRRHANRHIDAAKTAEILGPIGPISNEAQARELAPLAKSNPDAAAEVWAEVVDEHGEKVTAKKIKEAVTSRMQPEEDTGEDVPTWEGGAQPQMEGGEITQAQMYQKAMQQGLKDEAKRNRVEEPIVGLGIRKAGTMEYVFAWSDGSANRVPRSVLLQEHDYKKCKHCSGYGVIKRGESGRPGQEKRAVG